jgi:hypothetical protein
VNIVKSPSDLTLLKQELDSIRTVIAKITEDQNNLHEELDRLSNCKRAFSLVCSSIENEMDRVRQAPEQLELDFEVE